MRIAIGISGASGAIYAKRLIEELSDDHELFLVISKNARFIFKQEIGIGFDDFIKGFSVRLFEENDFTSPIASGSYKLDACIITPCSVKTLSAIANGYADNLISRCADVSLKEKRKLLLLVREMPLSAIHLENMLKLSRMGAVIMPPCPAFYHKPQTIEDMVNFVISRVLDHLNIENNLTKRWG
ncbi:UbiX family flavin prenyltransferase [Hippea sp. KM1]|uniref:UbiX family flavin prenyltransferase n=1 Tax=Hippea sp. KM1 TaxID=944481 RepID=UPI00046CD1CE|nr:UbiX family flavin prenyltransferase [Hippea sp. KM1]